MRDDNEKCLSPFFLCWLSMGGKWLSLRFGQNEAASNGSPEAKGDTFQWTIVVFLGVENTLSWKDGGGTEHARKSRPPLEVRIHIFYSSMPESDGSELKRSVISLRREAISICLTNSVNAHCKSRINYRYQGEGVHYGSVTFEPELNRSDSSLGHDSLPIGHFGVVANRFTI